MALVLLCQCHCCGKKFFAKRRHVKTCGPRCRKRLSRYLGGVPERWPNGWFKLEFMAFQPVWTDDEKEA